jgi:UDP-N-acetylglucosamine 2-epimerase (non-hydrolysing)/GDP/UDP-N,N'-diacetylbacillosamine 2-epimerase (hydrolysing)
MVAMPDRTESSTRTIAVVTSSRADYCHLYWPLRELGDRPGIRVRLMVTGAHLAREFGHTVDVIEADGFRIDDRLDCLVGDDADTAMARTIGQATLAFADAFERDRPDLVLLVADRYEMLAPANAALAMRIPIAHIEGGERSEGAIDHAIRNALTMMSHLHFATTEAAAARIVAMCEEPWRVHHTGAPSLDHLQRTPLPDRQALAGRLGMALDTPPLVVAHHPVTLDPDPATEAGVLFAALERVDRPIVICFPNADAGTRVIRELAERYCSDHAHARLITNLEPSMYWSLLHHAAAMVGNSSSGIMESASIPLPAVNVGRRQEGRERPANVIDAPAAHDAILEAVEEALSASFASSIQGIDNPYGDGHAAPKIADTLATVPIDARLLNKHATEFEPVA